MGAARVPELERLLGLWRGDLDSTGYASVPLAYEIAMQLKPSSLDELKRQLYPDGFDGVADDVISMVGEAYKRFLQDQGRARRR